MALVTCLRSRDGHSGARRALTLEQTQWFALVWITQPDRDYSEYSGRDERVQRRWQYGSKPISWIEIASLRGGLSSQTAVCG